MLAALFWAFTWSALTGRAMLSGRDIDLLDPRRFFATSAGALIYWLVLNWIDRKARGASQSSVFPIIATILPASIAVLAIRLVTDWTFYETPSPPEQSLRWVMVWAGYFGMWVSGALALRLQRTVPAKTSAAPVGTSALPAQPVSVEEDALDWLIDACAEHLAEAPHSTKAALARHLIAKAGYPAADRLDEHAHNARIDLAWSIAARLEKSGFPGRA
jgi:hypothetical protein